ncbi:hypothetical protein ACFLYY_01590 [Patescibacteria group bacterium]
MKNDKELEKNILFDYLRNNLSTRKLCKKYPEIKDSTGFKSHDILKKFKLWKEDKGRLFLFTKKEALYKIERIFKNGRDVLDLMVEPKNFRKYKHLYVIAKNEDSLYSLMNGELRNLIQSFFKERKKQYGICQYKDCKNKNLDVAHHHKRDRKKLLRIVASKNKIKDGNYYKFDIYKIIINFLNLHKNNTVMFLCKKHHKLYDYSTNKSGFLKNIEK